MGISKPIVCEIAKDTLAINEFGMAYSCTLKHYRFVYIKKRYFIYKVYQSR